MGFGPDLQTLPKYLGLVYKLKIYGDVCLVQLPKLLSISTYFTRHGYYLGSLASPLRFSQLF